MNNDKVMTAVVSLVSGVVVTLVVMSYMQQNNARNSMPLPTTPTVSSVTAEPTASVSGMVTPSVKPTVKVTVVPTK